MVTSVPQCTESPASMVNLLGSGSLFIGKGWGHIKK